MNYINIFSNIRDEHRKTPQDSDSYLFRISGRNKIDFTSDYKEVFEELNKLDFFFAKSSSENPQQVSANNNSNPYLEATSLKYDL